MSVSTKGFITINTNPVEALNKAVFAIERLCSQNNLMHRNRHPFHFERMNMGSDKCFYVQFRNDREQKNNAVRVLQIGYFEDTAQKEPIGDKICLSIGCSGDSVFIVKACLEAVRKALGSGDVYFQASDFNNNYEGPLTINQFETDEAHTTQAVR